MEIHEEKADHIKLGNRFLKNTEDELIGCPSYEELYCPSPAEVPQKISYIELANPELSNSRELSR